MKHNVKANLSIALPTRQGEILFKQNSLQPLEKQRAGDRPTNSAQAY